MVRPLEAVLDRDLAGNEVDQRRWDEERTDPARPPLLQHQRGLVDGLQPADARADHDTGPVAALAVLRLPARILDRLFSRCQAKNDETVEFALVFGRYIGIDIEVAVCLVAQRHLTRDPGRKVRRVEGLDRADSRLGRKQPPPIGVDAITQRRHHSPAPYDTSPHLPPSLPQELAKIMTSRCS